MIRFSPVDCALEGFRLTREQPAAIAVWGGVLFVSGLISAALQAGTGIEAAMRALQIASQAHDMIGVQTQGAIVGRQAGVLFLLLACALAFNVVIYTALLRAVLKPKAVGRSFYLRVGRDELLQLGLYFVLLAIVIGATLVLALLASLIGAIAMAEFPASAQAITALVATVIVAALVYPVVRLTLAGPATFMSGKIDLREAWAAGRGQFFPMVGAYAMALALALLVWLLVVIVFGALAMAIVMLQGGGMTELQAWLRADPTDLSSLFTLPSLARQVVAAVMGASIYTVTMAPMPAIYRALSVQGAVRTF